MSNDLVCNVSLYDGSFVLEFLSLSISTKSFSEKLCQSSSFIPRVYF